MAPRALFWSLACAVAAALLVAAPAAAQPASLGATQIRILGLAVDVDTRPDSTACRRR
jgi:hypothetical protein